MAVNIKLKRSAVSGSAPTLASLELGELALNTYDGKAFMKKKVGSTETIVELASTSGSILSASYADNAGYAAAAGTANFATTAGSAATATSASFSTTASYAQTASYVIGAVSASYAATSSYADNFTVNGTLTAQTIVVQVITSSTDFVTGSTHFGTKISDTHQFTGSVTISGSLAVNDSNVILTNQTSSMSVLNAQTASYAGGYTLTSSFQSFTSSYLTDSGSSSTRLYNLEQFSGSILNYTASTNATIADILVETASLQAATASLNAFSASILNYTASTNAVIADILIETASLQAATASLNAFSASIISFTSSYYITSGSVSNRIVALEQFSSSLDATFATDADLNALSSSFVAYTASINNFSASLLSYTASAIIDSGSVSTRLVSLEQFSSSLDATFATDADLNALSSSFVAYTASLNAFSSSILNYTASNNSAIASIYSATASLSSSIAILSGSFLSASSSFDTRINSLTESVFTHVVTNNGASNYIIDGVAKPILSFVPGATYKFDTTAVGGSHPFRFSTSPNGPTQYTAGVISGSNYIQIEVNYDTPTPLYYYCTIHSGMGNEINVLRIENLVTTASFNNFSSSLNAFSASILNYTASTNAAIADILLETASFNAFSSSILNYTSSTNAAIADILLETASINLFSASLLSFTASQKNSNGTFATTGSNIFEGVQTINSNLVVTGSITAQTLVVQTITSSVDFVTGSTHFGTILENTHQFTGSVSVSGSLAVNGSNVILTNQTASMSVATASYWSGSINNVLSASYALTASHATNVPETASFANNATSASYALTSSFALNIPQTASFANNATSASFALTASYWSGSIVNAQTASYVVLAQSASYWSGSINNALSSSYALTASYAINVPATASNSLTASYVNPLRQDVQISGSLAISGSVGSVFTANVDTLVFTGSASISGSLNVTNGVTGSLLGTASFANNSTSASFATTASYWSGSIINAQTASYVVLAQSASYWSGSIQNAVSASFAELARSASFASTASFALNGGGGGLSALYIQDEGITQGTASYIDFVGDSVTATVTNGTASITISGGGGGTAVQGASVQFSQPTASTTWSINHAINSRTPVVEVYDSNYNVIIPTGIYNPAPYQTEIYFEISQSGFAIISTGGVLSVSGSNAILNQNISSSTWTFNHELNNLYPVFTIYDSNNDVIIPQRINVVNTGSAVIYFSSPRTGTAVASIAGNQGFASSSLSASYAATASFVRNAQTASYWSGSITNVLSASYAATASYWSGSIINAATASYVQNAQTASYVLNAVSASYSLNSTSASYALTASYWSGSILNAETASYVQNAQSASYATSASYSLTATSSSYALTASYANNITISGSIANVDYIDFDLTASFASALGRLGYDNGEGTLQFGLAGGNVTLNIGSDLFQYVYNAETSSLTKGQVVYVSGSQGNRIAVKLANDSADRVSASTLGFVAETILAGGQGWVMTEGNLRKLNTTGLIGGKLLFLGSTPGTYTQTPPVAPKHAVRLGYAERIDNTVGSIYIKIDNGYEIGELHDVVDSTTSSSYGDLLVKSGSVWTNSKQLTGSYSLTGSLQATSFTGSLSGTASFADNTTSASFASTASYWSGSIINAATASFVQNAQSASYWSGSINNALSASYAATASYADNFTVAGTLTAQTLVVQTITSSVIYSSGSNVFGNDLTNTQQLTGSVTVTGSLAVNGSNVILSNQTSSMSVATASYWSGSINNVLSASYAATASFVTLAQSASYWSGSIINAETASFVTLAQTASFVTLAQTASYWSGSIQNAVSAAFADLATSASYASTASFALNGGGGGISAISIADEGILLGSASYFDFTGAGVTTIVNAGTASFTITGGGGSGTQGLTTTFTQSSAAANWSFTHNLNTRTPVVQVYDSGYNQITPQSISSSNANEVVIGFGVATTGYAVISTGGALVVTGSNVILNQTASATTWSFNHGLNQQYPVFQVFNTDDEVIVPERIKAVDSASALIYFPTPVAGKAIASFAGLSGSIGGGSGAGFPFSGSAVITGSFLVSGSFVDFTQVASFTGNLTGTSSFATSASYATTASFVTLAQTASFVQNAVSSSFATTASYAIFALTASTAPGYTVQFTQSTAAATWSFTHNMNTRNPIVQVYDSTYKQIIPNDIVGTGVNTAEIRFDYAATGYAVMSNGGGLYITGSTSELVQTSAATTWSFTHNLNSKYIAFEVYDSNDYVIIPAAIRAIDVNNAELHFASAITGRAVAQFSGINGAPNATTASYALTATSASYANVATSASYSATASYLNPITSGYVVLSQVSASLNFANDTAASASGVPLGGLYRNGNFIMIRLT
jgi:hypothetical protein